MDIFRCYYSQPQSFVQFYQREQSWRSLSRVSPSLMNCHKRYEDYKCCSSISQEEVSSNYNSEGKRIPLIGKITSLARTIVQGLDMKQERLSDISSSRLEPEYDLSASMDAEITAQLNSNNNNNQDKDSAGEKETRVVVNLN